MSASVAMPSDLVMPAGCQEIIFEILKTPKKAVVAITGVGGQYLGWLMGTPGISGFFMDAFVPYMQEALAAFLGEPSVSQAVSRPVVAQMAAAAYAKACPLSSPDNAVGIACSGTIATNYVKKGPHHAFVCVHLANARYAAHINFEKGKRNRFQEECVVSELMLRLTGIACGVTTEAATTAAMTPGFSGADALEIFPVETLG
ncbi:hypothetical protein Pelo_13319 [Pelomyxa schiedti]|nr:hypothetical protein Pelo_13319 [Pelomyxa schiedti]